MLSISLISFLVIVLSSVETASGTSCAPLARYSQWYELHDEVDWHNTFSCPRRYNGASQQYCCHDHQRPYCCDLTEYVCSYVINHFLIVSLVVTIILLTFFSISCFCYKLYNICYQPKTVLYLKIKTDSVPVLAESETRHCREVTNTSGSSMYAFPIDTKDLKQRSKRRKN
uniref:Uncharacterized protein n=1 Tax=Cacopsylla melanoneura TaxID=428564 RepID=A0A8D9F2M1_9HEMI